jgi:hypothetical protein
MVILLYLDAIAAGAVLIPRIRVRFAEIVVTTTLASVARFMWFTTSPAEAAGREDIHTLGLTVFVPILILSSIGIGNVRAFGASNVKLV